MNNKTKIIAALVLDVNAGVTMIKLFESDFSSQAYYFI